MAFNSNSYHRNRFREDAVCYMRNARESEGERRSHFVRIARLKWRMYLSMRRVCELEKKRKGR
jgi:hypothetical protein